jgi:hypothetical protein
VERFSFSGEVITSYIQNISFPGEGKDSVIFFFFVYFIASETHTTPLVSIKSIQICYQLLQTHPPTHHPFRARTQTPPIHPFRNQPLTLLSVRVMIDQGMDV